MLTHALVSASPMCALAPGSARGGKSCLAARCRAAACQPSGRVDVPCSAHRWLLEL